MRRNGAAAGSGIGPHAHRQPPCAATRRFAHRLDRDAGRREWGRWSTNGSSTTSGLWSAGRIVDLRRINSPGGPRPPTPAPASRRGSSVRANPADGAEAAAEQPVPDHRGSWTRARGPARGQRRPRRQARPRRSRPGRPSSGRPRRRAEPAHWSTNGWSSTARRGTSMGWMERVESIQLDAHGRQRQRYASPCGSSARGSPLDEWEADSRAAVSRSPAAQAGSDPNAHASARAIRARVHPCGQSRPDHERARAAAGRHHHRLDGHADRRIGRPCSTSGSSTTAGCGSRSDRWTASNQFSWTPTTGQRQLSRLRVGQERDQ